MLKRGEQNIVIILAIEIVVYYNLLFVRIKLKIKTGNYFNNQNSVGTIIILWMI